MLAVIGLGIGGLVVGGLVILGVVWAIANKDSIKDTISLKKTNVRTAASGDLSQLVTDISNFDLLKKFGVIREDVVRGVLLNMLILIGRHVANQTDSSEKTENTEAVQTLFKALSMPQVGVDQIVVPPPTPPSVI